MEEIEKKHQELLGNVPTAAKLEELVAARIKEAMALTAPSPVASSKIVSDRRKALDSFRFMLLHSPKQFDEAKAKALNVAVGADGGFLVPEEFSAEVERKLIAATPIRGLATVISGVGLKGGSAKEKNTITLEWGSENTEPAESNPTWDNMVWSLNVLKGLARMSRELVDNAAVDVIAYLSTLYAEQAALFENLAFTTGSGSGRPLGFRNATGLGTIPQSGPNINYANVASLFFENPSQYRANSAWMAHGDVIEFLAKILDGNGRPIFLQDDLIGGRMNNDREDPLVVGWIFRKRVYENNHMAATELGFGDFSSYRIFEKGGMEVESTDIGAGAFEKHQIAVKMIKYLDGKVGIADRIKILTGVTAP
jgi:HK97 family phage major capsid protein